ncbi:hypothetical protein Ga0080559_TMP3633 [Salipiger profundus]|uniref:Uncharacterized protein n=1 Tax=Salipiger profundus TaxID=1229727 RepID=A0A1U7D8G9_9RHOB|nr:hypothetical protein Ga0080559_TMP3633 [Salipiger profundus]
MSPVVKRQAVARHTGNRPTQVLLHRRGQMSCQSCPAGRSATLP